MIKKFIGLLMALVLATMTMPAAVATSTTYNQTYTDDDNGGPNIWQSITAGYGTYWAVKGGAQVLVINTTVNSGQWGINVTVHSGPFFRGSIGDQVYTLSRNQTYILGPFDLSRFLQANGTILVESNATRGKAIGISVVS